MSQAFFDSFCAIDPRLAGGQEPFLPDAVGFDLTPPPPLSEWRTRMEPVNFHNRHGKNREGLACPASWTLTYRKATLFESSTVTGQYPVWMLPGSFVKVGRSKGQMLMKARTGLMRGRGGLVAPAEMMEGLGVDLRQLHPTLRAYLLQQQLDYGPGG